MLIRQIKTIERIMWKMKPEMENTPDRLNFRFETTEHRVSQLKKKAKVII